MIYRHLPICLLLILIPLSAKAFPPASPAGGNYLVLDGDDDYAVLDFKTFGRLLPNGTEEFTIEAWVYPTTPPDNGNTSLTILHQQARMFIVNDEFQPFVNDLANVLNIEPPKGDLILLMSAYREGKLGRRLPFPIPLESNQWHHIAYQSNGPHTTMIVNDFVAIWPHGDPLGHNASRPLDFVLGGFGKIIEVPVGPNELWFWDSFTGYIDEVRISTEARYDVDKKGFMPDGKFKNDAKTAALWHFDETSGTREFSDASGNAYHLVGIGGAETGLPLAVEAAGKLTTTWGRLKQLGSLRNRDIRDLGTQR
ncbi:hypothetical protein J4G07_17165 [Candidatus Poribacteria bacterium]|nr:hypothetical protein [Candidatus Poribacteria bacterium]